MSTSSSSRPPNPASPLQAVPPAGDPLLASGLPADCFGACPVRPSIVFQQLFANSLDGVVITDEDAVIAEVNPSYERLTGFTRTELLGQKASIVKSGLTDPEVFRQMWEALQGAGHWTGEVINRRKSGEIWYSFLSIVALRGPGGGVIGYVGMARDVTAMHAASEALSAQLREIRATQKVTIATLARIAEFADPLLEGHLERIQAYSRILAEDLAQRGGWTEMGALVEMVEQSCLLHDLGKAAIPSSILLKPGRLSPEEFALMQKHTVIGGELLGDADDELRAMLQVDESFLSMARDIALYHHERWDGTGYPHGLKGPAIPRAARLVALADVYDALTSRRVYKPPYSHEDARAIVIGAAGSQFDPDVVQAFLRQEQSFINVLKASKLPDAG